MNISEFCKIYTGTGFPIEFQGKKDGKYPFYKVSDISASNAQQKIFLGRANNYIDEFDVSMLKGNIIPAGTIVFAKIGEALKLNKRAITSCECLIDNNVIGIKPDDNIINLLYFYYYLLKIDMIHYSESTTLPSVRKSTIEKIEVKIPPIDVQNKRVSILNLCHETIKYKVELLYNLELLVKSRFVEMFGDLNNNPLYPVVNLKNLIIGSPLNGFFASKELYDKNGKVKLVGVKEVVGHLYTNICDTSKLDVDDSTLEKYLIDYGDMLFCRSSLVQSGIAKASIVPKLNNKSCIFECHIIKIKLDQQLCIPEFMQVQSEQTYFRNQVIKNSKTATMTTISQQGIVDTKVLLPPLAIQQEFTKFLSQINKLKIYI